MILAVFFEIRTYPSLKGLVHRSWYHDNIRAFPLKPRLVDNDCPAWDGGGIPLEVEEEIIRYENEEAMEYFDDIVEEIYAVHKIGGYPAFCQSGNNFGEAIHLFYKLPPITRPTSISWIVGIFISIIMVRTTIGVFTVISTNCGFLIKKSLMDGPF